MKKPAALFALAAACILPACSDTGQSPDPPAAAPVELAEGAATTASERASAAPVSDAASAAPSSAPGTARPRIEDVRDDAGGPGGDVVKIAEDGVPVPIDNR